MSKMESEEIEFCKSDYEKTDDGKLWFANVGILHDSVFQSVIKGLPKISMTTPEVVKLIAITSLYLQSDLELTAHRVSPIVIDALCKRFMFITKLCEYFPITKSFIRNDFIDDLITLINHINFLQTSKYQTECFDGDESLNAPIAKLIIYLEALLYDMKMNFWLKRWLCANGYNSCEITVIYHCFFVPIIPLIYAKQFSRKDDETVVEKIEYYCFCKIKMTENVPILYQNQYFMVECIFDPFKGRYLGLLDMIGYISKLISPQRYEFKHYLTLAKISEDDKEFIKSFNKDASIKLMKVRKCETPV